MKNLTRACSLTAKHYAFGVVGAGVISLCKKVWSPTNTVVDKIKK